MGLLEDENSRMDRFENDMLGCVEAMGVVVVDGRGKTIVLGRTAAARTTGSDIIIFCKLTMCRVNYVIQSAVLHPVENFRSGYENTILCRCTDRPMRRF
jgi:hypothetical protein